MSKLSVNQRAPSAPWRLVGFSGLLALCMVGTGKLANWSAPVLGRAELVEPLQSGEQGWQLSLDLDHRSAGSDREILAVMDEVAGSALTLADREMMLDELVLIKSVGGSSNGKSELKVVPQTDSGRARNSDPKFSGFPLAVFEWSRGAQSVRGNLYQSQATWGAYSGRLYAVLPFSGLDSSGPGFSLTAISQMPACEQLLVIDASLLRFAATYQTPIEAVWRRWEFFPLKTLGSAIGPALIYARWKGESLFGIGVRDHETVEAAIDKRFPESVVASTVRRSYGTKVRGFDPTGPAWYLRGDTLVATTVGGTERLVEVLTEVLSEPRPKPSLLMQEISRLSALEPDWHLLIAMSDPNSALHWAMLLRWPTPGQKRAEGFLVVVPQKLKNSPLAPGPTLDASSVEPVE